MESKEVDVTSKGGLRTMFYELGREACLKIGADAAAGSGDPRVENWAKCEAVNQRFRDAYNAHWTTRVFDPLDIDKFVAMDEAPQDTNELKQHTELLEDLSREMREAVGGTQDKAKKAIRTMAYNCMKKYLKEHTRNWGAFKGLRAVRDDMDLLYKCYMEINGKAPDAFKAKINEMVTDGVMGNHHDGRMRDAWLHVVIIHTIASIWGGDAKRFADDALREGCTTVLGNDVRSLDCVWKHIEEEEEDKTLNSLLAMRAEIETGVNATRLCFVDRSMQAPEEWENFQLLHRWKRDRAVDDFAQTQNRLRNSLRNYERVGEQQGSAIDADDKNVIHNLVLWTAIRKHGVPESPMTALEKLLSDKLRIDLGNPTTVYRFLRDQFEQEEKGFCEIFGVESWDQLPGNDDDSVNTFRYSLDQFVGIIDKTKLFVIPETLCKRVIGYINFVTSKKCVESTIQAAQVAALSLAIRSLEQEIGASAMKAVNDALERARESVNPLPCDILSHGDVMRYLRDTDRNVAAEFRFHSMIPIYASAFEEGGAVKRQRVEAEWGTPVDGMVRSYKGFTLPAAAVKSELVQAVLKSDEKREWLYFLLGTGPKTHALLLLLLGKNSMPAAEIVASTQSPDARFARNFDTVAKIVDMMAAADDNDDWNAEVKKQAKGHGAAIIRFINRVDNDTTMRAVCVLSMAIGGKKPEGASPVWMDVPTMLSWSVRYNQNMTRAQKVAEEKASCFNITRIMVGDVIKILDEVFGPPI